MNVYREYTPDLRDKGDLDGSHVYINEEYIKRKNLFTTQEIKGTIAKWYETKRRIAEEKRVEEEGARSRYEESEAERVKRVRDVDLGTDQPTPTPVHLLWYNWHNGRGYGSYNIVTK